jgi:hypothetical protein
VWKLATRSQAPSGRAPRRTSSEERRGWSPAPTVDRTELRLTATGRESAVGRWTKPTVRPGPGLEGETARAPPSGSGHDGSPEGPVLDWTRWDEAGHQGIGRKPIFGWTDARFAHAIVPGPRSRLEGRHPVHRRRPVNRVFIRRSPVVPPHTGRSNVDGPSRLAELSSTATDSSVVGQGRGCGPRSQSRRRGVASGRQVGTRQRVGRMDGLGIWLREVNSPGWVRWRGDEPHGRTPGSDRSASTGPRAGRYRELVPEGRFKARRGATPIIYPVGVTVGGNTPGSRHAKDEGGAVKPNERLSPTVRYSVGQNNFREGSRRADGNGTGGHLGVLTARPRPLHRRPNIAFST